MAFSSLTVDADIPDLKIGIEVTELGTVIMRFSNRSDDSRVATLYTGLTEARQLQAQLAQVLLAEDQKSDVSSAVLADTGDIHVANMARHYGVDIEPRYDDEVAA